MKNERENIAERCVKFSLRIIRLFRELNKDDVGRIIGKQLLRSATSIGANVAEAQGAQSRADFISKMSIAQKEAHETAYWFRLITESEIVKAGRLDGVIDENAQILKIVSKILVNAKKKHGGNRILSENN